MIGMFKSLKLLTEDCLGFILLEVLNGFHFLALIGRQSAALTMSQKKW